MLKRGRFVSKWTHSYAEMAEVRCMTLTKDPEAGSEGGCLTENLWASSRKLDGHKPENKQIVLTHTLA